MGEVKNDLLYLPGMPLLISTSSELLVQGWESRQGGQDRCKVIVFLDDKTLKTDITTSSSCETIVCNIATACFVGSSYVFFSPFLMFLLWVIQNSNPKHTSRILVTYNYVSSNGALQSQLWLIMKPQSLGNKERNKYVFQNIRDAGAVS